jgi:hypothetical protein
VGTQILHFASACSLAQPEATHDPRQHHQEAHGEASVSEQPYSFADLPVIGDDRDGNDRGQRAAQVAAERWLREGRGVRAAEPPGARDFNDVLREKLETFEPDHDSEG